ncbi:hypothetical protein CMU41_10725, partial [Elizabethkingia anophelis]|nr:hypothetical protein [Elizabethkingia anophelis]MDV3742568.1 hypothetical protein [Elizabethkingia anophelis]
YKFKQLYYKKLQKKDLKSIKGGNPRPPASDGSCPSGLRRCTIAGGDQMCVSLEQVKYFCLD